MNSPLSSSATVELRKTDVAIEIPEFQLDLQRKGASDIKGRVQDVSGQSAVQATEKLLPG